MSSIGKKPLTKKQILGGPMQIEEIRMNKSLLKEINKMKKDQTAATTTNRDINQSMDLADMQRQINDSPNKL